MKLEVAAVRRALGAIVPFVRRRHVQLEIARVRTLEGLDAVNLRVPGRLNLRSTTWLGNLVQPGVWVGGAATARVAISGRRAARWQQRASDRHAATT